MSIATNFTFKATTEKFKAMRREFETKHCFTLTEFIDARERNVLFHSLMPCFDGCDFEDDFEALANFFNRNFVFHGDHLLDFQQSPANLYFFSSIVGFNLQPVENGIFFFDEFSEAFRGDNFTLVVKFSPESFFKGEFSEFHVDFFGPKFKGLDLFQELNSRDCKWLCFNLQREGASHVASDN